MIPLLADLPLWVWPVAVLCIWNGVFTFFSVRTYVKNKKLLNGVQSSDIQDILHEYIKKVGIVQAKLSDVENILSEMDKKSKRYISKVGVVRYNPFGDTGGDQSFVVALMDELDDGVVITSMHGRDRTRMYSKPIKAALSGDRKSVV